jgi:hypothetical protein
MHKVQSDRPRLIFKSVVEERLSTTGLFGRKNQFHAQALQNTSHILKSRAIELIAEAGKKKLSFSHFIQYQKSKHKGTQRKTGE